MASVTKAFSTKFDLALSSTSKVVLRRVSTAGSAWSNGISFGSPESDFVSRPINLNTSRKITSGPVWSGDTSFASPEADFSGAQTRRWASMAISKNETRQEELWSNKISFASPESDFVAQNVPNSVADEPDKSPLWSNLLSFASPESDFSALSLLSGVKAKPQLPKTFAEALMEHHAAIVVTTATAPHTIIHVNRAWEVMCGFTKEEVVDKTLSLIQGKDTNKKLVENIESKLENHCEKELDMYLINYRKNGESFTNHLTLGRLPLNDENTEIEFFVGLLEEVKPEEVPLRMID